MRVWLRFAMVVVMALVMLASSFAVAVSYTVQVVAVSSEDSAARFQSYLRDEGFPAYLVSVPNAQGYIFRLRVGSFANRAAAAAFAENLAQTLEDSPLNSSPSPALAEGIPQDLIPLEAELLGRYDEEASVTVRPWGDSAAVRTQSEGRPATYFLDTMTFEAWQAEPQEDGSIVQIYNEYLWPEAWPVEAPETLENYRQEQLTRIAAALELDTQTLSNFEYTNAEGVPYLVLARSYDPETQEAEYLPAVGKRQDTLPAGGPELEWLAGDPLELPNWLPLFEAGISEPATDLTIGDWQIVADEGYIRLQSGERGWRAATGTPLWVGGNFLLSEVDGEWQLYRFGER